MLSGEIFFLLNKVEEKITFSKVFIDFFSRIIFFIGIP